MKIILETRNAKLIEKDGFAYKSFNNTDKNTVQSNLLDTIYNGYKPTKYLDITLRAIKYYGLDDKYGIKLELLSHGDNLSKYINPNIIAAVGIWLSQFQISTKKYKSFPKLHGDFHLNNGFYDYKDYFIVFYDPEPRNNFKYIEYDIYTMSHSIFINSLKRLIWPKKYLQIFFENLHFDYSKQKIYDVMEENLANKLSKTIKRKYSWIIKWVILLLLPVYKLAWRANLKKVIDNNIDK